VKDIAAKYGSTSYMNRVGHAFIKQRMKETNAIFGGEVTGHYYFRDNFYADNGFHSGAADAGTDVEKKARACTSSCSRSRARTSSRARSTRSSRAWTWCRRSSKPSRRSTLRWPSVTLDGRVVEYPDWHFNVRPSNTEPLLA